MVIHIGIQDLLVEEIDPLGETTGDAAIAEDLAHHGPILAFGQGIVVGLPGARFGERDEELLQQLGCPFVDVFRAIIRVETQQLRREGLQQLFQDWEQIIFTDLLDCSRRDARRQTTSNWVTSTVAFT